MPSSKELNPDQTPSSQLGLAPIKENSPPSQSKASSSEHGGGGRSERSISPEKK